MRGLIAIKRKIIWEQFPSPVLKAHEVRILVHAAGINRADLLQIQGLYDPPAGESEILGLEIAGEIIEIGTSVTQVRVGTRVCALLGSGGYATKVVLDERRCIEIPKNISYPQAAAIPEGFFTAMANLPTIESNHTVFVRAAASGVGVAMLQLCALETKHSNIIGQVSSETKQRRLTEKLPGFAIVQSDEECIERFGKDYANVILNLVGGATLEDDLRMAASGGTIVVLATLGGKNCDFQIGQLLRKHLTVKGSTLRSRTVEQKIELTERFKIELLPLFESGKLHPIVDKEYSIEHVDEALKYVEQRRNVGKVILRLV